MPLMSTQSLEKPRINISGVEISPGKYIVRVTMGGLDFDSSIVSKDTAHHMFGLVVRALGLLEHSDGGEGRVSTEGKMGVLE
jgi:hypothetical protein